MLLLAPLARITNPPKRNPLKLPQCATTFLVMFNSTPIHLQLQATITRSTYGVELASTANGCCANSSAMALVTRSTWSGVSTAAFLRRKRRTLARSQRLLLLNGGRAGRVTPTCSPTKFRSLCLRERDRKPTICQQEDQKWKEL